MFIIKKLTAFVLTLAFVLTMCASAFAYTDVISDNVFFAQVMVADKLGIIPAYNDDIFRGDARITRADALLIMYKVATGNTEAPVYADASTNFVDVESDSWYGPYVKWANDLGLISSIDTTAFKPMGDIFGGEFASMLVRILRLDQGKQIYNVSDYFSLFSEASLAFSMSSADPVTRYEAAYAVGQALFYPGNILEFEYYVGGVSTPTKSIASEVFRVRYSQQELVATKTKTFGKEFNGDILFKSGVSINYTTKANLDSSIGFPYGVFYRDADLSGNVTEDETIVALQPFSCVQYEGTPADLVFLENSRITFSFLGSSYAIVTAATKMYLNEDIWQMTDEFNLIYNMGYQTKSETSYYLPKKVAVMQTLPVADATKEQIDSYKYGQNSDGSAKTAETADKSFRYYVDPETHNRSLQRYLIGGIGYNVKAPYSTLLYGTYVSPYPIQIYNRPNMTFRIVAADNSRPGFTDNTLVADWFYAEEKKPAKVISNYKGVVKLWDYYLNQRVEIPASKVAGVANEGDFIEYYASNGKYYFSAGNTIKGKSAERVASFESISQTKAKNDSNKDMNLNNAKDNLANEKENIANKKLNEENSLKNLEALKAYNQTVINTNAAEAAKQSSNSSYSYTPAQIISNSGLVLTSTSSSTTSVYSIVSGYTPSTIEFTSPLMKYDPKDLSNRPLRQTDWLYTNLGTDFPTDYPTALQPFLDGLVVTPNGSVEGLNFGRHMFFNKLINPAGGFIDPDANTEYNFIVTKSYCDPENLGVDFTTYEHNVVIKTVDGQEVTEIVPYYEIIDGKVIVVVDNYKKVQQNVMYAGRVITYEPVMNRSTELGKVLSVSGTTVTIRSEVNTSFVFTIDTTGYVYGGIKANDYVTFFEDTSSRFYVNKAEAVEATAVAQDVDYIFLADGKKIIKSRYINNITIDPTQAVSIVLDQYGDAFTTTALIVG